jgi:ribosome biogenesis protein NSA1
MVVYCVDIKVPMLRPSLMTTCSFGDPKGLSGAVTSMAPSPTVVATTALDRFARIHSTSTLPQRANQQVETKGEVLEKVYTKSIPTVVIWDSDVIDSDLHADRQEGEDDSEDENVWNKMANIGDSDGDDALRNAKRSAKKGRLV